MSRIALILGTVAAASILGCSDPQNESEAARARTAVVGGTLSDPADDGVIHVDGGESACTGSLIAPRVVLTALHCITEFNPLRTFSCDAQGNGSGAHELGPFVAVEGVSIWSGVMKSGPVAFGEKLFGTGSTSICQFDLGLVVLDRDLDLPLIPVRLDRETKVGTYGRAIGYGLSNNSPGSIEGARNVREHVRIVGVGETATTEGSPFSAPFTIVVGEGPCTGDSGGPLLSEETGAAMGVYSILLSSQCSGTGIRSAYTQIAPFESVVRDALEYAGQEPILEEVGTGGTTGTGGDAGAPGQGGEAGEVSVGGSSTGGTGGSGAVGGGDTGGTGGSGDTGGTGGSSTGGTSATGGTSDTGGSESGTGARGEGSGSRRDPACTCRTGGSDQSSRSLVALLVAAFGLALRRRARGEGRSAG